MNAYEFKVILSRKGNGDINRGTVAVLAKTQHEARRTVVEAAHNDGQWVKKLELVGVNHV